MVGSLTSSLHLRADLPTSVPANHKRTNKTSILDPYQYPAIKWRYRIESTRVTTILRRTKIDKRKPHTSRSARWILDLPKKMRITGSPSRGLNCAWPISAPFPKASPQEPLPVELCLSTSVGWSCIELPIRGILFIGKTPYFTGHKRCGLVVSRRRRSTAR